MVQGMTRPGDQKPDPSSSPPDATSPTDSYPGASESLIPWLKGLGGLPPLHGSSSAPVTPPISSPRAFPPVKPEWDSGFTPTWTQYPSLAAAAVAAQAATGAGTHFLVAYCDTPTGTRTPVEGAPGSEPVTLPATALEFASVCSPNWANGVRVQSEPWRPLQKSVSVPVSPVSSRMRSFMGEQRLAKCPSELDLAATSCPAQHKLGALWELNETVGTKRKVTADDLELTLGNSSLRAL
jgi:hypothetical protein